MGDSDTLMKAISFFYLSCTGKLLILPCIYHLFLLHVSRPKWFQTKWYILSFYVYLHFLISSLKIKTFQAWWSKMPYSLHGVINENTETLNKKPWDMKVNTFSFSWRFFAVHSTVDLFAFWLFANFNFFFLLQLHQGVKFLASSF